MAKPTVSHSVNDLNPSLSGVFQALPKNFKEELTEVGGIRYLYKAVERAKRSESEARVTQDAPDLENIIV